MECAILFGYSLCTQSSASRANRAACASSKSEAPIRPPHRISPATIDRIMNVSYPSSRNIVHLSRTGHRVSWPVAEGLRPTKFHEKWGSPDVAEQAGQHRSEERRVGK